MPGVGRSFTCPREALQAAGIEGSDPSTVLAHPALAKPAAAVVERARVHFAKATAIMARSPRSPVRAPRLMGEVYRNILDRLVVPRLGGAPGPRPDRPPAPPLDRLAPQLFLMPGRIHIVGAGLCRPCRRAAPLGRWRRGGHA